MKQDLTLNIGTKYDGDGFKKVNSAINSTAARAKSASKAIGGIQTALGGLGGEAGKVAGQVGGIAQAFTQMGIAGGIIAAGTLAIEGLFKWLNKTNDALSELAKGFGDKLKSAVAKVNSEIAKTNKLFENLIGGKKTKAERENIVDDFGIAQMEEQKKQALAGKEGVEAAKLELEWTKKIEDAKEKQSKKHLQDVKDEIALVEQNLKKQQEAQKEAELKFKTRNQLSLDAWNNDKLDAVTKNRWADDARVAKAEWKAFDKPIEDLKKKLEELRTKELKATKDAELAPEKKKSAVMQAEAKIADELKKEADAKKKLAEADKKKAEEEAKKQKQAETASKKKQLEDKRDQILAQDNQTAVQRLEAHKKEAEAAKQLAAAEKKAASVIEQWKGNTAQSLNDWGRQKDAAQRAAEKVQQQQGKNLAGANKEASILAGRVFGRNGKIRKSANGFDIGRFADAADYLGFNGVSDEQIAAMRQERDRLGQRIKSGRANGRDKDTFKRLDNALGNLDAVKNAEQKRKDAEKAEKERAEKEDRRTESLKKIQDELKKLAEKAGI